jgi:hypothetical protein
LLICVLTILHLYSLLLEKFKFSWLKTKNEKKYARERLNARLMNFVEIHSAKDIIGSEDDPFNFDGDVSPTKDEVDSFISDKDKSLTILERHPAMKKVFLLIILPCLPVHLSYDCSA